MSRAVWAAVAALGTATTYLGLLLFLRQRQNRGFSVAVMKRLLPVGEPSEAKVVGWLRRLRGVRRIQRAVDRSRLPYDAVVIWLGRVAAGLLLGFLLHLTLQIDYLLAIPLGWWGSGALLKWFFVRARKATLARLIVQLPDVARSLAHATRAGASVTQALTVCASEFPDPAGGILQESARRLDLGQPLAAALEEATTRLESADLQLLVRTITIQHRLGGNLPGALLNLAQTHDERIQSAHEVQALLASTRSSALLLPWAPWLVALCCNMVMPGFLLPLLSGWGLALVTVVSLLQGLGVVVIIMMTPTEV